MNCLVVDDEEVSRKVVESFVARTNFLNLVGVLDNALDAYEQLKKQEVDILFLDIDMPNMSGIELVESLDNLPQVILITGRTDVGAKAFEYGLTDYLEKPVNYPRFLKAVEKARNNLGKNVWDTQNTDHLYVKVDGRVVRLLLDEILFVEALSDYVIINTPQKKHIVHSTMKGLVSRLPESQFARVHRSYIVNVDKLESIEEGVIVMPKKQIPIGASYKEKFLKRLNFL